MEELVACANPEKHSYTPVKHSPGCFVGKLFNPEKLLESQGVPIDKDKLDRANSFASQYNFFLYFVENGIKGADGLRENNLFYQKSFDALRDEDNSHNIPDKWKFEILFVQCFVAEYKEFFDKLDVTEEQKISIAYDYFKKYIPSSFYVEIALIYYSKLKNKQRKNDINDYKDIVSLAQALPYCDAVITENYWGSLIVEHGLDKQYNSLVSVC